MQYTYSPPTIITLAAVAGGDEEGVDVESMTLPGAPTEREKRR